ncbi:putative disease resistance protein RGA3 [Prunus avium]|uniref:Disease resistance protein RGA3 n=1 Tax=Prunus avium TaxID=42229 RepID=A0A6P5RYC2_PRUAV|nr:putative disease resistance protein RGA3 [Prunus avium]
MAEALVSVVLEQLASISLKQIEEEVNLVIGVDQEVQNLILHLQAVQGLLQDAEERQVKEANVKSWLYNLKDASYQINDVLDEWNTAILKHHMEKQEKECENNDLVLAKRNKVWSTVPSFLTNILICFGQIGDRIIMRHDIAKRIKEINERLTLIAILRNNYNFRSTVRGTEQVERSKTTSFVDMSTIIGREEEKRKILSMLKSESRHQLLIPIVGMGGLGKTAFAQSVYNDQNVTTHFHKRIWVCVSDPFEEIKIAKAIIEVLNKDDTRKNSNEFQTLSECISENIDGIKFLLVLDDVWNPTDPKWEPLKEALQKGDANSRILVTTRNNKVAIMMGATNDHMINLNKLSDQDCLLIFRRIAFFEKEKDESKLFDEDIKNKIAKKVDGLPLAAKTLASLMRYKKTRNEWVAVLESKMWELEEVEQQVFQSLLLSYYDLTPAVRRCLLFCAVFPKDYEFDRNELIECWMSQEYLSMKGDREKERMIGQQYFDNLVMRSFFQDFVKDRVNDDIIAKYSVIERVENV